MKPLSHIKHWITSVLVLLVSFANGQNTFQEIFGTVEYNETVGAIFELENGEIYQFGQTGTPSGFTNVSLHKLDAEGNVLDQWYYSTSSNSLFGAAVYSEAEDQFICTYQSEEDTLRRSILAKINRNGMIVWQTSYGQDSGAFAFQSLEIVENKSIVASGFRDGSGFGNDVLVVKFDSLGNEIWTSTYGADLNEVAWSSVTIGDDIFVFGDNQIAQGSYEVLRLKIDNSNGNVEDFALANWPHNSGCRKAVLGLDSSIYVIGESASDSILSFSPYLMKYDRQGHLIWQKLVELAEKSTTGFDITVLNKYALMYTGYSYNDETSTTDMHVSIIDTSGYLHYKKHYDSGALIDIGYTIVPSQDGIIIGGKAGLSQSSDYFLVKDSLPELPIGFEELRSTNNIYVYPVPSQGTVFFQSDVPINKILIMDAFGRALSRSNYNWDSRNSRLEIFDKTGVFFIKIIASNNVLLRRIVIQK